MIGLTSLLSGAFGAVGGMVQGVIEKKQDNKKEIEVAKINASTEIELAKLGVSTKEAEASIEKSKENQKDVDGFIAYADVIKSTSGIQENGTEFLLTRIQNFIVGTTRPIITYVFLSLVFYASIYLIKTPTLLIPDSTLAIFELIMAEFSGITSYWFVRRSYEKNTILSDLIKKKAK